MYVSLLVEHEHITIVIIIFNNIIYCYLLFIPTKQQCYNCIYHYIQYSTVLLNNIWYM